MKHNEGFGQRDSSNVFPWVIECALVGKYGHAHNTEVINAF